MTSGGTSNGAALVRELRWGDFDDLREAYYRLYEERDSGAPIGITLYADRPSVIDEAEWFAGLYRESLSGRTVVSVAEVAGHAVGSCTIGPVGRVPGSETAHVGELGILVRDGHRGRGVGTALLAHALDRARERFDLVRLWVFEVNVGAVRLYQRFGFERVGRMPGAVRRGGRYFDELLFVLDLRSSPAKP